MQNRRSVDFDKIVKLIEAAYIGNLQAVQENLVSLFEQHHPGEPLPEYIEDNITRATFQVVMKLDQIISDKNPKVSEAIWHFFGIKDYKDCLTLLNNLPSVNSTVFTNFVNTIEDVFDVSRPRVLHDGLTDFRLSISYDANKISFRDYFMSMLSANKLLESFKQAIKDGNFDFVRDILAKDFIKKFSDSRPKQFKELILAAFIDASKLGHVSIAKALMETGAVDVNKISPALLDAVGHNHADLVKYLITIPGINLNINNWDFKTLLEIAKQHSTSREPYSPPSFGFMGLGALFMNGFLAEQDKEDAEAVLKEMAEDEAKNRAEHDDYQDAQAKAAVEIFQVLQAAGAKTFAEIYPEPAPEDNFMRNSLAMLKEAVSRAFISKDNKLRFEYDSVNCSNYWAKPVGPGIRCVIQGEEGIHSTWFPTSKYKTIQDLCENMTLDFLLGMKRSAFEKLHIVGFDMDRDSIIISTTQRQLFALPIKPKRDEIALPILSKCYDKQTGVFDIANFAAARDEALQALQASRKSSSNNLFTQADKPSIAPAIDINGSQTITSPLILNERQLETTAYFNL